MFCLLWWHYAYLYRKVWSVWPVGCRGKQSAASNPAGVHRLAWILLAAGVAINLPKLATPLREDKRGYRQASQWLAENTPEGTKVLVDDIRAGFYADRPYRIQRIPGPIPAQFEYAVLQQSRNSGPPEAQEGRRAEAAYSTPMNSRSQERVVVYRMVESSPSTTPIPPEPPRSAVPDQ